MSFENFVPETKAVQPEKEQSYNKEEWEKLANNHNKDILFFDNIKKGVAMNVPPEVLEQYIYDVMLRAINQGKFMMAHKQIKNSGIKDIEKIKNLYLAAYNSALENQLFDLEALSAKELWGEESEQYKIATKKDEEAKQAIKEIANLNIELPTNVSLSNFIETMKSIESKMNINISHYGLADLLGSVAYRDLLSRLDSPDPKAREISLVNFLRPYSIKIKDISNFLSIKFTTVKK